ncbi:DENN domain-containing protein [Tieghemostelium lacteum]|uniref:DENN domain-containing protein n=1 Tax=Tieghemostelium lacteum TaxID=361077 RepID=A0A151ZGE0_TIELA|nr:DENN domain-containing protein [Tieghemostelium lacteum]|eukprot:KYQ92995.1 DENN domain-containing protein [Tieghemostelium lacteum]
MLKIPSFIKTHKRTASGRKQLDVTLPDVEALTNDERISRLNYSGVRRKSSTLDRPRLFEWFLVIGVKPSETVQTPNTITTTTTSNNITTTPPPTPPPKPPLIKSATVNSQPETVSKERPTILYQYPPDKSLENISVEYFPFPNGIPVTAVSQTASHTNLFQMLYPQRHLKQPEDSFIFMLTDEKKQILYGVCTTKITQIGSLLPGEKYEIDVDEYPGPNDYIQQVGETILTAPKSYVILTRYPLLPLHFEIIKGVLAIQHFQEISRFQNIISQNRKPPKLTSTFQINDNQIKIESNSSVLDSNNNISEKKKPILELIEYFYNQPIPLHGGQIEYEIKLLEQKVQYQRGLLKDKEDVTSDYRDYLLDYGLFVTLQLLTHKTILVILNSILLEKKVVFFSKSPRCLTSIIFSVISLLKPFQYQSVILPLLPSAVSTLSVHDLLSAPVPYIIGLTQVPPDVDTSEIVLVDIDQNKIISKTMVEIFPKWTDLANKMIQASNKLRATINTKQQQLCYTPSKEQEVILQGFTQSIETYLTNLFDNFQRHCIRNVTHNKTISIFLKESFIQTEFQSVQDQHWISEFLNTLTFSVYQDQKLRQKDNDLLDDDINSNDSQH